MRLKRLRLKNFQSFGPEPAVIEFGPVTFLIGPNGSGKTAALRALSRLFSIDRKYRATRLSDFHVAKTNEVSSELWIEAEFDFPELCSDRDKSPAVPDQYKHLTLESADAIPVVRIRLTATLDGDGEIDEVVHYITQVNDEDEPISTHAMSRYDRAKIQVHYLPARRDPTEHISFGAATLIGRILRASDWTTERERLKLLSERIENELLVSNRGVAGFSERLATGWSQLHKGTHYRNPSLAFEGTELEVVLRNLSVNFSPGHGSDSVSFKLLSDGQQSLLYLSLILCVQSIYSDILSGTLKAFDAAKLRPPTFSMIVMEEPENSLSPHYLGRVVAALNKFAGTPSAQAAVATHAPSMLRRVAPENIRYLRLNEARESRVRPILLPADDAEAGKFVKEAVQAYPELYFSRLVVLGEGDSESIVLPRLLKAVRHGEDDASISVVPLGGRHVNHFWRLLQGLKIPYITILDLDVGRYHAGWGRVKYVLTQLQQHDEESGITDDTIRKLPAWNDADDYVFNSSFGKRVLDWLENRHRVYFSSPLDLDFAMLLRFPSAYGVADDELGVPDEATLTSVLGKSAKHAHQYEDQEQAYFAAYHRIFKLESKPVAHIAALSRLTDQDLLDSAPEPLQRLLEGVQALAGTLPE